MQYYISTIVWGQNYIDSFLNITLKSLLTEKNINNSNLDDNSLFVIGCLEKDEAIFNNDPTIKLLKDIIDVKLISIDSILNNYLKETSKYEVVNKIQEVFLQDGKVKGFDIFFYVYPDTIYSNETIHFLKNVFNEGKKIAFVPGPLISLEGLNIEVNKYDEKNKKYLGYDINYLSKTIIDNLHPYYQNLDIEIQKKIIVNSGVVLKKNKDYLLISGFNLHPLALSFDKIRMSNIKIEKSFDESIFNFFDFNQDEVKYVEETNRCLVCSVESNFSERAIVSKESIKFAIESSSVNDLTQHITNYAEEYTSPNQRITFLKTFKIFKDENFLNNEKTREEINNFDNIKASVFTHTLLPDSLLKKFNKNQFERRQRSKINYDIKNNKRQEYLIIQNKIVKNVSQRFIRLNVNLNNFKIKLYKFIRIFGLYKKKLNYKIIEIGKNNILLDTIKEKKKLIFFKSDIYSTLKSLTLKEKTALVYLSIMPQSLIRYMNKRLSFIRLKKIKGKYPKVINIYKLYGRGKLPAYLLSIINK